MPRGKGKPFGTDGHRGGRPKGALNKATLEMRDLARRMTTANPAWVERTMQRLVAGKESATVVVELLHYAHGKPKETIALDDLDKLGGTIGEAVARLTSGLARLAANEPPIEDAGGPER